MAAFPVLLFLLSCGPDDPSAPTSSTQIDHVIVGVGDLQMGMDRFEELTGVRPVFGGEHPGRGTRNALVSLGPRVYLELLAPQEGVDSVQDAPGLSDLAELNGWGWAAGTNDLESALTRIRAGGFSVSDPAPGSRATPDGGILEWRTGGPDELMLLGAPFLIEWAADSPHPATTSPAGCELLGLRIHTPNREELVSFLRLLSPKEGVEAVQGPEVRYEISLGCPKGEVTFR
jgi:hypothetical protein